jgi:hypothetical protein
MLFSYNAELVSPRFAQERLDFASATAPIVAHHSGYSAFSSSISSRALATSLGISISARIFEVFARLPIGQKINLDFSEQPEHKQAL